MTRMPPLETARLLIRPFVSDDLDAIHQILDVELSEVDFGSEGAATLEQRRNWLQWSIMNYDQLAWLYQPPLGDRAIVLKQTGRLIGAIGYVPCVVPYGLLPAFAAGVEEASRHLTTSDFGLYYALSPAFHRRGYATEAAAAMVDYAFHALNLRRIIATTTHGNDASMGVMRKLGMRIERNPAPEPHWLQIVGMLENRPSRQT